MVKNKNGIRRPESGKEVNENQPVPIGKQFKTIRRTWEQKSNLSFPVSRVRRFLKKGNYAKRIQVGSAVYLTSVLEYLCAEILELSGDITKQKKKKRIIPRSITLAIRKDLELNELLRNVTISEGGVVPHIYPLLLKKLGPKKVRKSKE